MREQLIQYVELLFAGVPDSEDMKQEILQNTLDRYDDLVDQGKTPEAAYRLAITGIGDINEILGNPVPVIREEPVRQAVREEVQDIRSRNMRAVAVAMYILCALPLIILSEFGQETIGLCMTLLLVAAATALMILSKSDSDRDEPEHRDDTPRQRLNRSISNLIWGIAVAVYFIVSFLTHAWYITWVIFLIARCVISLAEAITDLKEASEYEN